MKLIGRLPSAAKLHSAEPWEVSVYSALVPSLAPYVSAGRHTYNSLWPANTHLPSELPRRSSLPLIYISCLHEIGRSYFCTFSPVVILAVVERTIAGNYFIHFFILFDCDIYIFVIYIFSIIVMPVDNKCRDFYVYWKKNTITF